MRWDDVHMSRALELASLGAVMGFCVGLGALAGLWLDRRLNTEPWLALAGTVLGSAAAFQQLIAAVSTLGKGKDG